MLSMTTATDDVLSPLTLTRPLWDDPLTAALYAARATHPFQERVSGARIVFSTGRENEEFSGLYYYRARYYAPSLHRFISEDPIDLAGGDPNLYLYTFNSPTNFTDPSGEIAPLLAACLAGGLTNVGIDLLLSGRKVDLSTLLSDAALGCVEGVLGFGVSKLFKAAKLALAARTARGKAEIVQRAMSRAEVEATQRTGLLRGGKEG